MIGLYANVMGELNRNGDSLVEVMPDSSSAVPDSSSVMLDRQAAMLYVAAVLPRLMHATSTSDSPSQFNLFTTLCLYSPPYSHSPDLSHLCIDG